MTSPRKAFDACTLPSVEQPLRVAEFDAMFAAHLAGVDRLGPTKVRLLLTGPDELPNRCRT